MKREVILILILALGSIFVITNALKQKTIPLVNYSYIGEGLVSADVETCDENIEEVTYIITDIATVEGWGIISNPIRYCDFDKWVLIYKEDGEIKSVTASVLLKEIKKLKTYIEAIDKDDTLSLIESLIVMNNEKEKILILQKAKLEARDKRIAKLVEENRLLKTRNDN